MVEVLDAAKAAGAITPAAITATKTHHESPPDERHSRMAPSYRDIRLAFQAVGRARQTPGRNPGLGVASITTTRSDSGS
jgi:hypothetical protein